MSYVVGIDVSTTGVKAIVVDERGHVVGSALTQHSWDMPRPLWVEQNPDDWWNGTWRSMRRVLTEAAIDGRDIIGVGLTGQMHGLTLLDKSHRVVRPAILWNDQRTEEQCDEIRDVFGRSELLALTGNDAMAGFTLPKLLWVKENEPDAYARIAQILLPKDYVRFRLTGRFATDRAGASGTLILDIAKRDWATAILGAFGIEKSWLPPTHEGPEVTGHITPEAAKWTGIPAGTPVFAGAGDQAAQAIGVGASHAGTLAMTLGTSGVVFAPTDRPIVEPGGRLHAFCHAVPGRWHLMGVMLSAAGSLRWFRDELVPTESFDVLTREASHVPVGSNGLLFLPYLTGERTPYADARARGAFVGLTVRHDRAALARAVLEGVSFGLREGLELLSAAGVDKTCEIRISGGGARSSCWRQILSDVLGRELVLVNTLEGAAYGTALLAGVGAGIWASVDEACSATIKVKGRIEPERESTGRYEQVFSLYKELYPALRHISHELSRYAESY
ncbi:xylulokinase [Candidatus Bipolaricaulota bacterium]|nr:xylulokinase [Candidatus Bipolaricaulota bacterium]